MRNDPVAQSPRRVGIASALDPSFVHVPRKLSITAAESLLEHQPRWIIIDDDDNKDEKLVLLVVADLTLFIKTQQETFDRGIDLLEISAQRDQHPATSHIAGSTGFDE